jgi:ankyrin repeat protein
MCAASNLNFTVNKAITNHLRAPPVEILEPDLLRQIASHFNRYVFMSLLISQDSGESDDECSALESFINRFYQKHSKAILDCEGSILRQSMKAWTPLDIAPAACQYRLVELLLKSNVSHQKTDKHGATVALHHLMMHFNKFIPAFSIAEKLVDAGADVNATIDAYGWSALEILIFRVGSSAYDETDRNYVRMLCNLMKRKGLDLNRKNSNGETILHQLVHGSYNFSHRTDAPYVKMIGILVIEMLSRGVDPTQTNNDGLNPGAFAMELLLREVEHPNFSWLGDTRLHWVGMIDILREAEKYFSRGLLIGDIMYDDTARDRFFKTFR